MRLHPAACLILLAPLTGAQPAPLKPQSDWHLRGGMITGGFVTAKAQQDWPRWMRTLVSGASPGKDLAAADLRLIPDMKLPRAVERLRAHGVFSHRLLAQVTVILHAAPARAWQKAKTAYMADGIRSIGLPLEDPTLLSRLVTQLCQEGRGTEVLQALERRPPKDSALGASLTRRVRLAMDRRSADPVAAVSPQLPLVERLQHVGALRRVEDVGALLKSFQGTWAQSQVVHTAVVRGWLSLQDPRVDEALNLPAPELPEELWVGSRPADRRGELHWLRLAEALESGNLHLAKLHAKGLLEVDPEDFHAGHAAALLGQGNPVLRTPGDLTWPSVPFVLPAVRPLPETWEKTLKPLADKGRFDLILLQVDPDRDRLTFLRAAREAGQIDLGARLLATTRGYAPDNLLGLFPQGLGPTIARLLDEEGVAHLVDVPFVLAMMKNESLFQPGALSGANAYGLLQLLRPTFRAMMGRKASITDPITNLRAGLRYYKRISQVAGLEGFPPVVRHAYIVAGYHAGEGRARRWSAALEARLQKKTTPAEMVLRLEGIPITSTRLYVARVLGDAEIYRSLTPGK